MSTGVWSTELRFHPDRGEAADAAAELEALGYDALYIPGGIGGDVLGDAEGLLTATEEVAIVLGVLNVWMHDAAEVATMHARLDAEHPGRLTVGLGVSHPRFIDGGGRRYARPLATMRSYLDALDGAEHPLPRHARVLAALGPRMLALAASRSAGAHPYFVPVAHTRAARAALGPGPHLAPEQAVVLETDPALARAAAREHFEVYLGLPNYTDNLLRHGFAEDDLRDGGSDRLVDGLVAWGDEAAIAARLDEHRAAGADHVCVQVLGVPAGRLPRDTWRTLAPALVGPAR